MTAEIPKEDALVPKPSVPSPKWFISTYLADIRARENELLASITSTFGEILKIDSTRKVAKKLAGKHAYNAHWVTNVGNEFGQILNSVLTTSEGHGLTDLSRGLIQRYQKERKEKLPKVLYTDRELLQWAHEEALRRVEGVGG